MIGICGNIGSGKTTVARIFANLGARYLSADELGWKVLPKISAGLKREFGTNFFSDGKVDRKKLAEIVFANKEKLDRLNRLSHPILIKSLLRELARIKSGIVVVDGALLFDWPKVYKKIDFPILVVAKRKLKKMRTIKRGISENLFNKIISVQKSEKEMAQMAKDIIRNNGTLASLEKRCRKLFEELRNDC